MLEKFLFLVAGSLPQTPNMGVETQITFRSCLSERADRFATSGANGITKAKGRTRTKNDNLKEGRSDICMD